MGIAYLMLGSNEGERLTSLRQALEEIRSEAGSVLACSSVYETDPWGFEDAVCFYNQLVIIETVYPAEALLHRLLNIEKRMGRTRKTGRYSSRNIDIDILFYDTLVMQSESLTVPHPRIPERRFVLEPLIETCPMLIHPQSGKTVWQIWRDCTDTSGVRRLPFVNEAGTAG